MWQFRSIRVVMVLGIGILLSAALVAVAGAYANVLALAAGFSITDSRTLMIWDQLVDSSQIATADGASYSNCSGTFPISPTMELVCTNTTETNLFWPFWKKVPSTGDGASCVTSRYGTGVYQPISLDTPLQGIPDSITLDEPLAHFVHDWKFDQPAERRSYADRLAAAVLAQREPVQLASPPVVPGAPPPALPPTGANAATPNRMGLPAAGLALLAAGILLRWRRVLRLVHVLV
jgi:hypothetical protein